MAEPSKLEPSTGFFPPRWFIKIAWKSHKALYRWSGGRLGLRGAKADTEGLALLTTTGRRSGQPRSVMIGYFEDGSGFVTMAMNGWDVAEPAWWLNLQAKPQATLTTADGPTEVVGRAATGDDHDRLWDRWRELDASVDRFGSRRINGTTVVVLSPTAPQPVAQAGAA